MLHFLVRTTPARRVLEVGTLGGYSAAWMARALAPGGHLYTVELDAAHADFAESALAELGLAERVTVVRGAALEVLPGLLARVEGPLDVVFVDAVKTEYAAYLAAVRGRLAPGSLFLADNVLGTNSWWVTEPGSAARDAMDAFNRSLAQDADFDVCAVPAREGVLLARRR